MNIFLVQDTISPKNMDSVNAINDKIENTLKSSHILTNTGPESLTFKKIHNYKSNGREVQYKNLHSDNIIKVNWTKKDSFKITIDTTQRTIFFMVLAFIPMLTAQNFSVGWIIFTFFLFLIVYFTIRASAIGTVGRIKKMLLKRL